MRPLLEWQRAKHRFFITPVEQRGASICLTEGQSEQAARVLRLAPGDLVVVLDGSGEEWLVQLEVVTRRLTRGTVIDARRALGEPETAITLYQALVPREKFEFVLQKGTEIGVSAFVPIVTTRSVARAPLEPSRLARWQSIVREAAEQAHRGRLPRVFQARPFSAALAEREPSRLGFLASPSAQQPLAEALGTVRAGQAFDLWIGPEGGFTDDEVALARAANLSVVSLGPRILRTETAGLVLAAIVLYEAGELAHRRVNDST